MSVTFCRLGSLGGCSLLYPAMSLGRERGCSLSSCHHFELLIHLWVTEVPELLKLNCWHGRGESHPHLSSPTPAQSPPGPSPAPHLSPLPPDRLLPAAWGPPVLPTKMCLCHLTAPPGCHGGHRGPGGGAGAPTTLTRSVP